MKKVKNLFTNINAVFWFLKELTKYKGLRKKLDEAKNQKDFKKVQDLIKENTFKFSSHIFKHFKLNLNVLGKENIISEPCLFAPNHQGYADIFTLFYALSEEKQISFIARDDLRKVPFYGKWMEDVGSVFIKRNSPRDIIKKIDDVSEGLRNGFSYVLFPGGTRTKNDSLGEFKKGSLKFATKEMVPIVPVKIMGTYRFLEEEGVVKSTDITIEFFNPINTKNLNKEELNNLHNIVFKKISN